MANMHDQSLLLSESHEALKMGSISATQEGSSRYTLDGVRGMSCMRPSCMQTYRRHRIIPKETQRHHDDY